MENKRSKNNNQTTRNSRRQQHEENENEERSTRTSSVSGLRNHRIERSENNVNNELNNNRNTIRNQRRRVNNNIINRFNQVFDYVESFYSSRYSTDDDSLFSEMIIEFNTGPRLFENAFVRPRQRNEENVARQSVQSTNNHNNVDEAPNRHNNDSQNERFNENIQRPGAPRIYATLFDFALDNIDELNQEDTEVTDSTNNNETRNGSVLGAEHNNNNVNAGSVFFNEFYTFDPIDGFEYVHPSENDSPNVFSHIIEYDLINDIENLGRVIIRLTRTKKKVVKQNELKKIKEKTYIKGDNVEECMICIEEFENNQKVRVLDCEHSFHSDCIDKWLLNYNHECPVCRKSAVIV